MDLLSLGIAFTAAFSAGLTNAIAGGGTLITFPTLVALGIPPVVANVTNTVSLCPGFVGGVYAQRKLFSEFKTILYKLIPASIIGGLAGGYILLHTSEKSFNQLVPFLILIATLLLAVQKPIKRWVNLKISQKRKVNPQYIGLLIAVLFASVYGGYFGAGLGVILLATLGIFLHFELNHLNMLKQAISLAVNLTAAIYFVFSGQVNWWLATVMACGALLGGYTGGYITNKINQEVFKWIVVAVGSIVGIIYLLKTF
jgi:uncharacterized protein